VSTPPRSALLATWAAAWAAGEVGLPDAVERVSAHDDLHTVSGLDLLDDRMPLERAIGSLRAGGVTRWRVVLPVPGDLVGTPGPGAFTDAALAASEGVLALREDGLGTGLVPALSVHGSEFDGTVTTVAWTAFPVHQGGPDQGPFLHDAEHDLRRGVVEVARLLQDLDVARWRPEIADALMDLRRQARAGLAEDELPSGLPTRARELLVSARQLGTVVSLALEDSGGALGTFEAQEREQALRRLGALVRRAGVAAYNSHGLGA
jgi:hypothetical protein